MTISVESLTETCGCWPHEARVAIFNRPGQPALDYRIGTHRSFLQRMIALLALRDVGEGDDERRPLARLTTREPDDPAIALFDAWSTVADVLSFYQERIANEGFLRTATERRSVLELARTIGYELNPGVAASTYMAFKVDDRPPPPELGAPILQSLVPKGTKVQSMPAQGQLPQTFETSADFLARPEWNELRPRLTRPQTISLDVDRIYAKGVATGLGSGDLLLLTVPASGTTPGVETRAVRIRQVVVEPEHDRTRIDLSAVVRPPAPFALPSLPLARIFLQHVPLTLGHIRAEILTKRWTERRLRAQRRIQNWKRHELLDAIEFDKRLDIEEILEPAEIERAPAAPGDTTPPTVTAVTPTGGLTPVTTSVSATFSEPMDPATITPSTFELRIQATNALVPASVSYDAATRRATLNPTDKLATSMTYVATAKGGPAGVKDAAGNWLVQDRIWSFTTASEPPSEAPPKDPPTVYRFGERAGFFGHNAPKWGSLPKGDNVKKDPYPRDWDTSDLLPPATTNPVPHPRTIWIDSQGNAHAPYNSVHLERTIAGLANRTWAIFESAGGAQPYWLAGVTEKSVADYTLNAKVEQLTVVDQRGVGPTSETAPPFRVRETTAHVASARVDLAEIPIDDPLKKGEVELVLDRMVLDLDEGKPVILSGERRDLPGVVSHEALILDEIIHEGGFTTLHFRTGLENEYVRRTVRVNANVVATTHGETVQEILGGGDGSQANQRFTLKRPPLTYVSAPTPSGAESTLEIRIDGVRWDEAPRLYDLDARSQSYVVRLDDDGKPSVVLGDGERGARTPTGAENVRAVYRTGIGPAGMVGADRLTLLQTRPLGIQSVTNPLAAAGAAAPENRDDARINAPLTVVAMDRIVSLRDFDDFARAFAGIGKAKAVQLAREDRRLVHLTIAAANGAEVAKTSSLYLNLIKAIDAVRDPGPKIVVESYDRRFFNVEAEIVVDPRRIAADVLTAGRAAIADAFSFRTRDFGQPVTAAEVVTVIQNVEGVIAAFLTKLYAVEEDAPETVPQNSLAQVLPARRARLLDSGTQPAQLLLVNPAAIDLVERTA